MASYGGHCSPHEGKRTKGQMNTRKRFPVRLRHTERLYH